ncbi:MAG TPA: hypothetical protein VGD71_22535 [Kribbella sp.]|jgi:hypothetical protein
MDSVITWTGRTASALQEALRLTNESFAEHLGIAVRTVAAWHQKPALTPKSEMQQLLDTALERATPTAKTRFTHLLGGSPDPAHAHQHEATAPPLQRPGPEHEEAERRLSADPYIHAALDWLDHAAARAPGTSRAIVASRLAHLDLHALRDRGARRRQVDQPDIARALSGFYREQVSGYGRYAVQCSDGRKAATSILTCADWLDLDCAIPSVNDRLRLTATSPSTVVRLDESAMNRAAQRLAETLALGIRLVDMPLYDLHSADIQPGRIAGAVQIAPFVQYALTMDLLEGEIIDAISAKSGDLVDALPLRARYLPDTRSILDLDRRLCAGGVLALSAIARPASIRNETDYLLIVQERSGHVLNAARKLAVIPTGFHQPLTDLGADTQIGATLLREMEEELFGRDDIDNTVSDQRSVDPMHPTRLSAPMLWLNESRDVLRMECTGFGLNLVSGNYEFASLIVIDDEEFWVRFGGQIEASWESSNLRRYSSLDDSLLTELIGDVAWSNEGLFALLQGLRRLSRIGGRRVNLPTIEWALQR